MIRRFFLALVLLFVTFVTTSARAQDDVPRAREEFVKGTQLVKDADWAGALAAFETSAKLHPHPVTTFNIGACYRAMGQYTLARASFASALEGKELSPALADETRRYVSELDGLLAVLDLTLTPDEAFISIDGRPLDRARAASDPPTLVAGTLPPGAPSRTPKGRFRVVLDPGVHVIVIGRPGFADVVVQERFAPKAVLTKSLQLDRLPAHLRVTSNLDGAQVLVNDADVGVTPVDISRPAGRYHVVVKQPGYLLFDTSTKADPGQSLAVTATLREDKPALTQRWWFWTGVGVLVVGAAITTYAVTRPDAERPALNGGGLGWTAKAP